MQLNHEIESETFGSSWQAVQKSSNDFFCIFRENFRFLKKNHQGMEILLHTRFLS